MHMVEKLHYPKLFLDGSYVICFFFISTKLFLSEDIYCTPFEKRCLEKPEQRCHGNHFHIILSPTFYWSVKYLLLVSTQRSNAEMQIRHDTCEPFIKRF